MSQEVDKNDLAEAQDLVAADDRKDIDFASRGFMATRKDSKIRRRKSREYT